MSPVLSPGQAAGAAAPLTVVGAGPVGTLLALLLARAGRTVQVLEGRADPRTAPPQGGRSINLALAQRGLRALAAAGVLDAVRPEMVIMPGRQLHEPGGGETFLPYGSAPGEVVYAVGRSRLNAALIEAAARIPQITLCFGQRCTAVDPATGTLQVRDAATGVLSTHSADLIVAADGAGSALRSGLAERGALQVSEAPLDHDYKELLIPATAAGGYVFNAHALHIWPRGGHMLIALPNPDGSFTATLFLPAVGLPSFAALATPGAARRFFLEQFPDALAAIPDFDRQFASHPQGQLGTVYCWPWHRQRALLIGDAAHAIVPFHGQGLNCGFEDCVLLARLLDEERSSEVACARFERERRPNTDAIAAMALENYQEMRAGVLAPDFARRKRLAADLERRFPGRFIPRYAMVMFHPEIPYAEAQRRGALQESVLDTLLATQVGTDVAGQTAAERLLTEAGL